MDHRELRAVKPIKSKEFHVKQLKLEIADAIPFRSLILSPSTGGKTTLIVHLIVRVYKNCFSGI